MTKINSLAPGKSQDVTFSYTVKESDLGRTDLINTITISADGVSNVTAKSAAANVEKRNETITATNPAITSTAGSGVKVYIPGETVTWETKITNTGNVDIDGLTVRCDSGHTINNGNGYSVSNNIAYANKMQKGATITIPIAYTVVRSNSDSVSPTISVYINDSKKTSSTGDAAQLLGTPPSNEAAFGNLSWNKIKAFAYDCAINGTSRYTSWVGWRKTDIEKVNSTTYYLNFTLVALKNSKKSVSPEAYNGFTFLSEHTLFNSYIAYTASVFRPYGSSSNMLSNNAEKWIDNMSDELKSVISNTVLDYVSDVSQSPGTISQFNNNKLFVPSLYELTGVTTSFALTYPAEGQVFDYFKSTGVGTSDKRTKSIYTKTSENVSWWTRTPQSATLNYMMTNTGAVSTYKITNTIAVPIAFNL